MNVLFIYSCSFVVRLLYFNCALLILFVQVLFNAGRNLLELRFFCGELLRVTSSFVYICAFI